MRTNTAKKRPEAGIQAIWQSSAVDPVATLPFVEAQTRLLQLADLYLSGAMSAWELIGTIDDLVHGDERDSWPAALARVTRAFHEELLVYVRDQVSGNSPTTSFGDRSLVDRIRRFSTAVASAR